MNSSILITPAMTTETDHPPPLPRLFRACRTCRRQKMKCEAKKDSACKRCTAARVDCIFDRVDGKKRRTSRPQTRFDFSSQNEKLQLLEHGIHQLQGTIRTLIEPPEIPLSSIQESLESTHSRAARNAQPHSKELASDALVAPALDAPILTPQTFAAETIQQQLSGTSSDPISRGILSEVDSREVFKRYMARCNALLPLFDDSYDTFDSLRNRSSFCLAAILSVATRLLPSERATSHSSNLRQAVQQEAEMLAGKTLFNGGELEDIQALIVLAAYSEKCWLLVQHAVNLAYSIHLDSSIYELESWSHLSTRSQDSTNLSGEAEAYVLTCFTAKRRALVWMTLAHLELEIASGTSRSPHIKLSDISVRGLLDNNLYPRSGVHILGAIDLLCIRDKFKSQIGSSESNNTFNPADVSNKLDDCFKFWEWALEEDANPNESPQRSFLITQRNHAELEVCHAYLKFHEEETLSHSRESQDLNESQLLLHITSSASKQLDFLLNSPAQKRNFHSSPVYSYLIILSTAIISLKSSKYLRIAAMAAATVRFIEHIDTVLQQYPFAEYESLLSPQITAVSENNGSLGSSIHFQTGNYEPSYFGTVTSQGIPSPSREKEIGNESMYSTHITEPQQMEALWTEADLTIGQTLGTCQFDNDISLPVADWTLAPPFVFEF